MSKFGGLIYGNTKRPSMYFNSLGLGRATLMQLAFLEESDPNFPRVQSVQYPHNMIVWVLNMWWVAFKLMRAHFDILYFALEVSSNKNSTNRQASTRCAKKEFNPNHQWHHSQHSTKWLFQKSQSDEDSIVWGIGLCREEVRQWRRHGRPGWVESRVSLGGSRSAAGWWPWTGRAPSLSGLLPDRTSCLPPRERGKGLRQEENEGDWLIHWLLLSPANRNDYLRTDWKTRQNICIHYTQYFKLIYKS